MIRAFRVVACAGKLLGDALHGFRVDDSRNIGLVLDIDLVEHHILFTVLFALLTCAIHADVSVDAVASLVVVHLRAQARLLLAHVVLVGGPAHVIADQITSIVYQLLLSLLLCTVDARTLSQVLTRSILMRDRDFV